MQQFCKNQSTRSKKGEKKNESLEVDKLYEAKKRKLTSKASSETNLRDWFKRKGAKGSTGGWVDCNTCRKDSKTGRTKCKPCGREEGEKRAKYPACRPTPGACKKYKETKGKSWGKKSVKNESINDNRMVITESRIPISENLKYHIDKKIPLVENIHRYGSESFFNLINEVRYLHDNGKINLSYLDEELIKTDIGKKAIFEGKEVWLDIPMEEIETLSEAKFRGKTVKTRSPQRSSVGGKAYIVYVAGCVEKTKTNPSGVKQIRFGSGGLRAKLNNPERRKAYDARHGCSKGRHNDKCKAGYWSCRLPRYAKKLGLSGGGTWW